MKSLLPCIRDILERAKTDPRQRGEGIVSTLVGATLGLVLLTAIIYIADQSALILRVWDTSGQVKLIESAAFSYLKVNAATIIPALAAAPIQVTIATLQSESLNTAIQSTDPYGGTYSVSMCLTTNGLIQVVVGSQGGNQVEERYAGLGAQFIGGASGGYMSYTAANTALGNWGTYTNVLSSCLTSGLIPSAGHLVAIDTYNPLDIGNASFQVVEVSIVGNGSLITKPNCPGTLIPHPIFSLAKESINAAGSLFNMMTANAIDLGSQWQAVITANTETQTGVQPSSTYAQATAIIVCASS